MRHVRSARSALMPELRLGPHDWPLVIGTVMTVLNVASLKRLGKRKDGTCRPPLEVMTGLIPNRQSNLHVLVEPKTQAKSLTVVRAEQLVCINDLQCTFDDMHKEVHRRVSENLQKKIAYHNKQTNLVVPNFCVGDFVLVRRAQDTKGHKFQFRWLGPLRITRVIGDTVYDVSGLLDEKLEVVHAARLQLYRSHLDGTSMSTKLLKQAEHIEAKFEMVDMILDIREADDGIFFQVQWLGKPDKVDWTWQSITEMYEDVPERVQEFLNSAQRTRKRVVRKARTALKIPG